MSETVEFSETITTAPAQALAGLLDCAPPDKSEGLPPLWHWVYLLDRPAQADLGRDGHRATTGVPHPPEPGRRRMWAGGSIRTHEQLSFDEPAVRRSYVRDSVDKQGRTGRLTFVTAVHEISQHGRVVVEEEQHILYRDAAAQTSTAEPAAVLDDTDLQPHERRIEVNPVLLFRFSALTYNGHRIHYDRDYSRQIEGYPGLVVHGPLQALLMAEAARALQPSTASPSTFDYRLVSPLFDHQGMVVGALPDDGGPADASPVQTTVRDGSGRTTASGTFRLLTRD
ncbi:MaoC family dehydratase N-terminal domain-containing protein [Streptomyces sp. NPDC091219]|uniref:FAS1-like dehydratase domain-containing protein n=1 Tax=Streptomyces sp. NPDC091219 TaxID=3155193 RepID=UPI00344C91D4